MMALCLRHPRWPLCGVLRSPGRGRCGALSRLPLVGGALCDGQGLGDVLRPLLLVHLPPALDPLRGTGA
jgi:hypothetical protein